MQHDWVPSTLGHGEVMCRRCSITNREAQVLGAMAECKPSAAELAYADASFAERACDACGKPYRGPAVYCSLNCAEEDA